MVKYISNLLKIKQEFSEIELRQLLQLGFQVDETFSILVKENYEIGSITKIEKYAELYSIGYEDENHKIHEFDVESFEEVITFVTQILK